MKHSAKAVIAVVVCAAAAAAAAVVWSRDRAPPGAAGLGPLRSYVFRATGDEADVPWNRTLFLTTADHEGRLQPAAPLIFFDADRAVKVAGREGAEWFVASESEPNAAILQILWTVTRRGTFGDRSVIDVPLPKRAFLRLTGDESTSPGDDTVTVAHEESGARLVALRSSTRGFNFRIFDASKPPGEEGWKGADHRAPPRPWVWNELRPGGKFVIAAKSEGRQWIARRAEMAEGAEVVLDVVAQPAGGGTVVCDDPRAELLLGGELPLPALWLTPDIFRARWTNVPPGRHAVRYQGGEVVPVEVTDGAEVTLPAK